MVLMVSSSDPVVGSGGTFSSVGSLPQALASHHRHGAIWTNLRIDVATPRPKNLREQVN